MAGDQDTPNLNASSQSKELSEEEKHVGSRFSPKEEAALLAESNAHKTEANTLFMSGKVQAALSKYDEAVCACPAYLDYELAVLKSNMAACYLKLHEWKDVVKHATAALEGLDRAAEAEAKEPDAVKHSESKEVEEEEVEQEIVSAGAERSAPAPAAIQIGRHDGARIRVKVLMRRARARSELGGWSDLEGALTDYKTLSEPHMASLLGAADWRTVQAQLKVLPARTKVAQERETAEMWAKLKDLGNGILKPFGLSTDNFQMARDEKTGGYSMNFQGQGGGNTRS